MTVYGLYLESGPRRRKTMVHVLDLLGCVAVGPTTDDALAAVPDAIRAYLRFLHRHGEPVEPDAAFETRVAEHITEGQWLGNGSPYVTFGPDLEPVTGEEVESFLRRFRWLREALATWACAPFRTRRRACAGPESSPRLFSSAPTRWSATIRTSLGSHECGAMAGRISAYRTQMRR